MRIVIDTAPLEARLFFMIHGKYVKYDCPVCGITMRRFPIDERDVLYYYCLKHERCCGKKPRWKRWTRAEHRQFNEFWEKENMKP